MYVDDTRCTVDVSHCTEDDVDNSDDGIMRAQMRMYWLEARQKYSGWKDEQLQVGKELKIFRRNQ